MPELPEVQTIVGDLNKKIVGQKIINIWSDWFKLVKKPAKFGDFGKLLKGKKILGVSRKGKNILIGLSDDLLMLVHQKMTGHLLVGKWNVEKRHGKEAVIPLGPKAVVADPYNRFIHLILYLDNGEMLALSDVRKFAKIMLGKRSEMENLAELKNLGPDPLDPSFKVDKFMGLISSEKRKIKQVLMDQEVIAGIGNIYSDEILWKAKIHPFKAANKLSGKEVRDLFSATKEILTKALKLRGTSISDYRDASGEKGSYDKVRFVYRKEGERCSRCGSVIKRIKMGGRSAHFCPSCQKI